MKIMIAFKTILATTLFIFFLNSCGRAPSASFSLPNAFQEADAIAGWTVGADLKNFTKDNLFQLVDGQAEAFFAYRFEQVAVKRYKNADGNLINVEIWQLAASPDAYGLFTSNWSGSPAGIGSGGTTVPGQRLAFWQNRYYIAITANKTVPDDTLWAFGKSLARVLPAGGVRPALVDRLPAQGLIAGSVLFFHEEISVQNEIWLGGKNILGLSAQTDGVEARYTIDGKNARLLMVQYPTTSEAVKGLEALRKEGFEKFITANSNAKLIAAVFGDVTQVAAETLIQEALK